MWKGQRLVIGFTALTFLVASLMVLLRSTPSALNRTWKLIEYATYPTYAEEDLGFKSSGEEHVPKHVSIAIDKLYRELKRNGSILNDQVTTADPIIPNVFHYVRYCVANILFRSVLYCVLFKNLRNTLILH